jgi:hypothetical protein
MTDELAHAPELRRRSPAMQFAAAITAPPREKLPVPNALHLLGGSSLPLTGIVEYFMHLKRTGPRCAELCRRAFAFRLIAAITAPPRETLPVLNVLSLLREDDDEIPCFM